MNKNEKTKDKTEKLKKEAYIMEGRAKQKLKDTL